MNVSSHVINYDPTQVVDTKHVCYYVEESIGGKVRIMEVLRVRILHPDSDGQMAFERLETRIVEEDYRHNLPHAGVLMEAQQVVSKIVFFNQT